MSSTSKTIYTYTCDLCGAEKPLSELRRLGEASITEGSRPTVVSAAAKTCDVCSDCQDRPVSDVLAKLVNENEVRVRQEIARMEHLMGR